MLFIAGTDTDVGKTVVAAGLLRAAGRAGCVTQAFKPVAAGCAREEGHLVNDDARTLAREAGVVPAWSDVNPVALEPAIAPHIAATRAGVALSAADLAEHCRSRVHAGVDLVVVEGAGGWLVPLNPTETMADLCGLLGAEVVLVVGMRLGCLSHALLTARDIASRGIVLAGWVASCIDPQMSEFDANRRTLADRVEAPCLGTIPWSPSDPLEAAASALDLSRLLAAKPRSATSRASTAS